MTRQFLSVLLALSLCIMLFPMAGAVSGSAEEAPAVAFTDVPADAYYAIPVQWAVQNQITAGTSDTTFSPEQTCTRGEIITFLWKAMGSPEPKGQDSFSDVESGVFYAKAAAWAKENGIAEGSVFQPGEDCTRLAAVEFLWKNAGSPKAVQCRFQDVSSGAVDWAVAEEITAGTSATTFSPDATCTRGQIITFLYRALAEEDTSGEVISQKYPDGTYTGQMKDGKRDGYGKMAYSSGAVYQGYWADDVRSGYGKQTDADGSVYCGEWADDAQNGMGILRQTSGNVYAGAWKDGKQNGAGATISPDGAVQSGQWKNGTLAEASGNKIITISGMAMD